jgi:uncharacterized protein (TIGR02453 family)
MAGRFTAFPPAALAFLRALKRNNDREWFRQRKARYEQDVRGPMVSLIERLAVDFQEFAPELVATPRQSMYRIYRDTRFSENKAPLKTQVAAVFPCRGLPRHQGAGLYLEVGPAWVWVGGGMYAPDTSQLQLVREHIAGNVRHLRAIVESPSFRRTIGQLEGEQLQRVPRGFARDHEAAAYLKYRQFLAGREYPPAVATSRTFYPRVLEVFRCVAPLVRFLNEPLLDQPGLHIESVRSGGTTHARR